MIESSPAAKDVKVFVPTKDYTESLGYYQAIGWKLLWKSDDLSELELGNTRIYLQNYYHKGWANNFMMYINVDSAQAWYDHINSHLQKSDYKYARVNPPKKEPHAIVTYAWDPCGVLLHFAEQYDHE